ncbi:GMC oxidoreductase [Allonocardiopsis opalescens]|uniref:Cholesterol oxidase n=1 Tax=Allonocardiopsis opalescens TaxID=1144618 RepID=A0A2T0Q0R1_9ACTN|nr:GMC family oxidoreductase [Allonocardiopsis opalescens]PRX97305.1 cholesterol oxidase [Allonocardiopsis opalescens]
MGAASTPPAPDRFDYDVLVIGSGFGGSVSALRLTEKGYRVGVLEAGRRFTPDELPKTSWRLARFLWAPALGLFGIQRVHLLRNVVVLAGAGVGGGSLNYANTLYEPLDPFFADPQWRHITDWKAELAPYYDQAKRMLGVTLNPSTTPADVQMRRVAEEMGVGGSFHLAPVGVYFGEPGREVPDPYFGGAGPRRSGCLECGECMTGCRHGAKNALTENYLYLAERAGARVHPMTTAVRVQPRRGGGYLVRTARTGSGRRRTFAARQVVFAAGTMGTQRLLHRMAGERRLPRLSRRLGHLTRTNSEALLGAMATRFPGEYDFTRGVAITSSFHPDPVTHVEPVRYGKGSNLMGLVKTLLVDGGGRVPRWALLLRELAREWRRLPTLLSVRRFSERSVIALVMQARDNSITVFRKRGLFGYRLSSRQGHGEPNPSWIPAGNEAVRRLARNIGGVAGGNWGEVFGMPMTAHFLGGCVIGDSPETGVVDPYHRVYGHPGLHVVDGSAVSANLGVNPSLTITAQAERAMALWPNRGEPDPRPPLGEPYRRLPPVPPAAPAVPEHAPGALRLPVIPVPPVPPRP